MTSRAPLLLVSVRSAREAQAALDGGADIIDVKEPNRGTLGRPNDATVTAIVDAVAGRRPISVALGEWSEFDSGWRPHHGVRWCKIGLAGAARSNDWQRILGEASAWTQPATLVPVAYADWQRASAPKLEAVLEMAQACGSDTFLIDTWKKDGIHLLEWLDLKALAHLAHRCQMSGLHFAVAGSLRAEQIEMLLPLQPEIIAVRGAACHGCARDAEVELELVAMLAHLVHSSTASPTSSGQHSSAMEGTRDAAVGK